MTHLVPPASRSDGGGGPCEAWWKGRTVLSRLSLAPSTASGGPPPPLRGGGTDCHAGDHPENTLQPMIIQNVLSREAEDGYASLRKPTIAPLIVCDALRKIVRTAIDLDTKAGRGAI